MRLAEFIRASSEQIIAEWEEFARGVLPAATLEQRRDHVAGMLVAIAQDLGKPQSKVEQSEKSRGNDDAKVSSNTSANSHGSDRAGTGYTPVQMVAEFRALRASIMRLWSEAATDYTRANLEELTRFNESIDQLLAESIATYVVGVGHSKDLFLGVLGHDLRTPLGAIMMSATTLIVQEGPDWPRLKVASRILNSCTRMDGLICDLVDFTRTRLGGGIPVVPAEMDLEETCRETVDEIAALHPRGIVNLDASGALVGEWDKGRIGQALSNLIGNAYQHGSEIDPIEVVLRGEPDQVVLLVHNKGTAIAKAELESIFDPFKQGEAAGGKPRDLRSAGLGLYIAKAIVTAHEGTIEVESKKAGTTFVVTLPRRPSEPRDDS